MLSAIVLWLALLSHSKRPPNVVLLNGRRIEFIRSTDGTIRRVIVTRLDKKPMTDCDPYLADLVQHYTCSDWVGGCEDYNATATGTAFGADEATACSNARAAMCQEAYCAPESGSYIFWGVLVNNICTFVG